MIRLLSAPLLLAALLLLLLPPAEGARHKGRRGEKGGDEKIKKELSKKEVQKRIRQAKLTDVRRKLKSLGALIQDVNQNLKRRFADPLSFERKRSLEIQLRDLITVAALTGRALAEADRLAREAQEILRSVKKSSRESDRLQLVNFLRARRREYIIFATR
ncbi:MAG: hypothetical protein V3V62_03510 [bacterium]